jgi:undecaprenyl pyrophosphate phosphatase UppP
MPDVVENKTNATESSPIDEFMLKEYESIASAHFDSQAGLRQQFRFYLIIAAVPVTVLGLALKDRLEKNLETLTFFNLPAILTTVFLAIGVLGFLLLLSMIHTALDATIYARTVNGVRNYFVEKAKGLGQGIEQYLVMPFDKKKPRYFHIRAFFWQVTLIAAVNTFYVAVFLHGVLQNKCALWVVCLLLFAAQLGIYFAFAFKRGQKEVSG